MGRKKIQCPDCGIGMFQSSLWKHQQESCKGVERPGEETEFSQEYIQAVCLEIQKDWSERERLKRMECRRRIPWQLPIQKSQHKRRGVDV